MKHFYFIFLFLAFYSSTFSQVNLDSGLVAYYPFSGNANDASANNNNPVFNNATLANDRLGLPNSAYYFNGIDNYMQIPNTPGINPAQISLCVFVKPMGFYRGPCHGNSVLMKGDADYLPGNYLIRFDDNAYTFQNNCNTNVVDTIHQNFYAVNAQAPSPGYSPYINKDQWYCIVYTYDGVINKLYIDGMLIHAESTSGKSFSNSYDLFFGRLNSPAFPYWFNGVMDEVRIYNRALTTQEVTSLCPSTVMPLTFTKFETHVIGKQIDLNWNVENEEGIQNFTIERSLSGHSDFIKLGTIASSNIHTYSYVDNTVNVNQNYFYRLAAMEKNNELNYSEIKTAKVTTKDKFIIIYPNPSAGNFVVKITGYKGEAKFAIINSVGQTITQKSELILDNPPPLRLSNLPRGIYWLKIETGNESSVERITVF